MKIVNLIARILLGLIFLVFGLNGFLNFIPAPMPTGLAGQFNRRLVRFALRGTGVSGRSGWRGAASRESFCSPGNRTAWTRRREHPAISLFDGARGDTAGSHNHGALADCVL